MPRILPISLLLLTSSCVGLGFVTGTKQVPLEGAPGARPGLTAPYSQQATQAGVLQQWGPPRRRYQAQGREVWVYRTRRLRWRGLETWGVVPVPLLLPVGHQKVQLEFAGEWLSRYTTEQCRGRFLGFFMLSQTSSKIWWLFDEDPQYDGYWGHY